MLVVYNRDNGAIQQVVFQAGTALENVKARHEELGFGAIMVDHEITPDMIRTSYVSEGEVVSRPETVITRSGNNISCGLPAKVSIHLGDEVVASEEVEASGFEFDTDLPGTYAIYFEPAFPYMPGCLVVTV